MQTDVKVERIKSQMNSKCDKNNRVAHGEQQICRCVAHASLQNAFFR